MPLISRCIFSLSLLAFTCSFGAVVSAHEYYLMPETFTPKVNELLPVRHRLGKLFKGNELPWITKWNIRSEVWEAGNKRHAKSLDGDRPALKIKLSNPRLATVVHQSSVDFLTFKTYEKFTKYVTKEGMTHALKASEEGTKPKIGLLEAYSRFAKTIVNVDGDTKGLDVVTGLKIELVALANPLALGSKEPMPVQVLYEGKPLVGVSVKVYEGIGNNFAYHTPTDANGKAMIKAAGPGPYLINAIHMTEPQSDLAKSKKAHWESFWASLTFQRKK
ncbi:MAG: DUF4198 domain-containing protein [Rhizobiaceae bacterium]